MQSGLYRTTWHNIYQLYAVPLTQFRTCVTVMCECAVNTIPGGCCRSAELEAEKCQNG